MNRPPFSLATKEHAPRMSVPKQLVAFALGGVLVPAALWALLRGEPIFHGLALNTVFQGGLGTLVCWYALLRLRTYARARLLSYVLPVSVIVFGVIFAFNAFLRLSLSYTLFLSIALATLVVAYMVTIRIRHSNPKLRHFIIPGGSVGSILGSRGFTELESPQQLSDLIDADGVSGSIVADLHHEQPAEWERLLAKAALKGIPVYHYRLIEEALTGEVRINHLRENDLGSLIPNLPYRGAKRLIDIAAVVLLSPILLPVMGIVALIVRLDSKGPVLFFQERLGYRGETFRMVKFRTMRDRVVDDNHEARRDDAMTKDDDDRITRVGRILRKSRLDELPQAWNILMGDMSWIGPRPEARDLADWYESEIPFYSYRHIVRPGITGWAQVNQGHVTDLDSIQSKLRYDFFYVKNLSLWLDVLIALKTLRVMAGGFGAR